MQRNLTSSYDRRATPSVRDGRVPIALAFVGSLLFAWGCGGADADTDAHVRVVSESERMPAPTPASAACADGETRECKITLNVRAGTVTCTTGIEECSDGAWGECFRTSDPEAESAQ